MGATSRSSANVPSIRSGTFSSVYKAIDLSHDEYDNSAWYPSGSSSSTFGGVQATSSRDQTGGKVFVALKRIYVTSSPQRIHNELDILNDLRSANFLFHRSTFKSTHSVFYLDSEEFPTSLI